MDKKMEKHKTSIRLSDEAKRLIDLLAETFGVSQSDVLEISVRKWAIAERILIPKTIDQEGEGKTQR
jgi:hypothetical protein